jgi:hypothetical protein
MVPVLFAVLFPPGMLVVILGLARFEDAVLAGVPLPGTDAAARAAEELAAEPAVPGMTSPSAADDRAAQTTTAS